MNWEALGAIGEIVGAIAVVLTLGYLAVQIRQNTRSLRAESVRQLLAQSSQNFMSAATSAELVDAQVKSKSREELEERDRHRLTLLAMAVLSNYENEFYQYRSGSLPEDMHDAYRRRLSDAFELPYINECLSQFGHRFSAQFRSYISALQRNTPDAQQGHDTDVE
jgi:hypothetical protein